MILKIVSLTGEEKTIDIEPTDTVLTLKQRLEEQEKVPPEQQRLVFAGKQLKNDRTLESYNVKEGTKLHFFVALRSGIFK